MQIVTISPQHVSLSWHFAGYRWAFYSSRSPCPTYKLTFLPVFRKSWPKFSKQLKRFGTTIVAKLHPRRRVMLDCCQRLWFWKWGPVWGSQTGQEWEGPCTANVWGGISRWKPSPSLVACSVPSLVAQELLYNRWGTTESEQCCPLKTGLHFLLIEQWVCKAHFQCSHNEWVLNSRAGNSPLSAAACPRKPVARRCHGHGRLMLWMQRQIHQGAAK